MANEGARTRFYHDSYRQSVQDTDHNRPIVRNKPRGRTSRQDGLGQRALPAGLKKGNEMSEMNGDVSQREELLQALMLKMIEFDAGDAKRIQHFVKVASFARTIGVGEGLDAETLLTLEAAAIVHDIGIHPALEKYGRNDGKLQEELGPEPARTMLAEVGFCAERCERVAYLVGHHHTYTDIDGADYQALVEADFLVNLFESDAPERAIVSAKEKIFRTATGTALLETMFGV